MCVKLVGSLSGERSVSKVAVIVAGEASAQTIAGSLRRDLGLADRQVVVVTPRTTRVGRALEPESRGILNTILIAHYKLGIVGLMAGILLFAVLYGLGVEAVARSPGLSIAVIASFGIVFGLMAGGLVALRPDHDPYVHGVRTALEAGQCAVVVHALDDAERERAVAWLSRFGQDVIKTL
jgi:hypothetical protein